MQCGSGTGLQLRCVPGAVAATAVLIGSFLTVAEIQALLPSLWVLPKVNRSWKSNLARSAPLVLPILV